MLNVPLRFSQKLSCLLLLLQQFVLVLRKQLVCVCVCVCVCVVCVGERVDVFLWVCLTRDLTCQLLNCGEKAAECCWGKYVAKGDADCKHTYNHTHTHASTQARTHTCLSCRTYGQITQNVGLSVSNWRPAVAHWQGGYFTLCTCLSLTSGVV